MHRSRFAALPLAVVVLTGLAACDKPNEDTARPPTGGNVVGGSPGKAAPGTPVKLDLCEVITPERAKQLIGDGAVAGDSSATECSYSDDTTGHSVNLRTENDPDGTQFGAERRIGGPADNITGLGDDAFYRQSVHTLYVRKGGTNLTVQIVTDPARQDAVLDDEKKLAAEIIRSAT